MVEELAQTALKVAQLVPYYAPVIGGVEAVCQYISEALVAKGHEVHVFTAYRNHKGSPRLKVPAEETLNGVHVHRHKSYVNVGHYGVFPGFISSLEQGGFDIIHAHGYRQPQSEIGARVGARLNVPTVLHVHGGFNTESSVKRLFYSLFDLAARRHHASGFDHFIALSEGDKYHLLELNVDSRDISIIQNAAEPDAFAVHGPDGFRESHGLVGKKVILYLSILIDYKRPDKLIRVLPQLVEQVPGVCLVFVGPDAGELEKTRRLAQELGVAEHCKWLGPLHGEQKHQALECAEFLALPSDTDPYPLSLLEAMAHHKPVLTTTGVGQASVIRDNAAGIVVDPGDLDGILSGASKLLTDERYRSTLGANARRLAERMFSVGAIVDEIERVYAELIDSKAAGPESPPR